MKRIILFYCVSIFPLVAFCQFQLFWNANLDLELTKAGSESHYHYNELHRRDIDLRFDMAMANVALSAQFNKHWKVSAQLFVERRAGRRPGLFKDWSIFEPIISQLNIQWFDTSQKWSISAGRLSNPFGRFYEHQLYPDRIFVQTPLAYSYYLNVSEKIGFVRGLGEVSDVKVNGRTDWGEAPLYRLGYVNGIQLKFKEAEKWEWALALVDRAPKIASKDWDIKNWAIISRFGFRPSYFATLGLSFSHGSFMEAAEINASLDKLSKYTQSLIALDYQLGFGFFQFSGELMTALYRVPQYLPEEEDFADAGTIVQPSLFSGSSYIDLKYDLPFLPGGYVAYGFDVLFFGKVTEQNGQKRHWDDAVIRHIAGMGYKITPFWQLKLSLSTQKLSHLTWKHEQFYVFRLMSSLHW